MDIIEIYGADALRYTLAAGATETQDLRIPVEKLKLPDGRVVNTSERFEQGRNFANKFWNAARFALMNLEGYEPAPLSSQSLPVEDRWIIDGLDRTIAGVTSDLEQFQFAEAARRLRDFTWGGFCDWYLEFVQGPAPRPATPVRSPSACWRPLLDGLCRLLHPIMPFVTEQVWQGLAGLAPVRGLPEPARRPRERLHRGLAAARWAGPTRRRGRRSTVVRGDQGDPQPEGRAERPQGRARSRRSSSRRGRSPSGCGRASPSCGACCRPSR